MKIVDKGRYWQIGIELVSGCTPCSPGCDNCWSAAMTNRFGAVDCLTKMVMRLSIIKLRQFTHNT